MLYPVELRAQINLPIKNAVSWGANAEQKPLYRRGGVAYPLHQTSLNSRFMVGVSFWRLKATGRSLLYSVRAAVKRWNVARQYSWAIRDGGEIAKQPPKFCIQHLQVEARGFGSGVYGLGRSEGTIASNGMSQGAQQI